MFVRILLILGLVKLLNITQNALLCAAIYSIIAAIFAMAAGTAWQAVLFNLCIMFVAAFIYFWALTKLEDSILWWVVFIIGLLLGIL